MAYISNFKLRTALRILLPFMIIPAVVWFGSLIPDAKKQVFVSLAVALLSLLLFVAGLERKEIGNRRMVVTSILIALSITGRLIPFFKPVTAITVIAAVYLGAEAGFLVGSASALLSGLYMGLGPWVPFQMLAWGLIGLIAGYLSGPLQKRKWVLLLYGVLSGVFFSMVMDIWTVLWYNGSFQEGLYAATLLRALPHTLLYAVSNFIFLYGLAKPFGEKLTRIKIKYGI